LTHPLQTETGAVYPSFAPPLDFVFASRLSCIVGTKKTKQPGQVGHRLRPSQKSRYRSAPGSSSMLDEGVCAEVKVGSEHLRLFSEQNAQGVQASVYNVNAKNWIAPSESVETIEQGKLRAATYAEAYLKQTGNLELRH